jgi:Tfp pilus assembly protein PilO
MFSQRDKKTLQLVGVVAVVAIVGLFFYQRQTKGEVAKMTTQITSLNEQFNAKKKELDELRIVLSRKDQITNMIAQIQEKRLRLPQTPEAREFYSILRECIQITNLSDIKIAPVEPVPMGLYEELPYVITCRARYHELGQFLMLVEQHSKQIMRIKTIDITNDLARPSRHPVTLRLATFCFLPGPKEVALR